LIEKDISPQWSFGAMALLGAGCTLTLTETFGKGL